CRKPCGDYERRAFTWTPPWYSFCSIGTPNGLAATPQLSRRRSAFPPPIWPAPWKCLPTAFRRSSPASAPSPRTRPCAWAVTFGTSPDLWMNLQKTYDLDLARQQLGKAISHIPQRPPAA